MRYLAIMLFRTIKKKEKLERVKIPLKNALFMIGGYARIRISAQVRSVAFIIVYLVVFKTIILGVPFVNALVVAAGIGLVVAGLTLFLEGLFLGLMPLGERVGLRLPGKWGLPVVAGFGLLVGFGATLAEPSFAVLRSAGENITPWDTPLLFLLLKQHSQTLIYVIGASVGLAVATGMIRSYFGLSIKPFILVIIPILLAATVVSYLDESLLPVIGLAWDAGAITTGLVTVPLVLALSIGVSRASGKREKGGGFGVIMLASALPVLGVMVLAMAINTTSPRPVSEEVFFSAENREQALQMFPDEKSFDNYKLAHENTPDDGTAPAFSTGAGQTTGATDKTDIGQILSVEWLISLKAIIPLCALFLVVLLVLLRDRPRFMDQVIFGILLSLAGMTFLTSGIRIGLSPLGEGVGSQLPRAFSNANRDLDRITIENFDTGIVFESIAPDGTRQSLFYLRHNNETSTVEYVPEHFDAKTGRYLHMESLSPLFGADLSALGIALVILFAFGLGYGSTLAEPALKALADTVEDLTVGMVRQKGIIKAVSVGVGMGLVAGISGMLFDIPSVWLILPPYLLLLPLTLFSSEEFAGVSWDCGGVTTGPVTVPLVLAMGLGIGDALGVAGGFGILALASVYPVLSVMMYGFSVRLRQRRLIYSWNKEENDE